jgi:hypothetical protein
MCNQEEKMTTRILESKTKYGPSPGSFFDEEGGLLSQLSKDK